MLKFSNTMGSVISSASVSERQALTFFSHIMDDININITTKEIRKRLFDFDIIRNTYEKNQRLDNVSKMLFFWGVDNLHITTKFSDRIEKNWPSSFIGYSFAYGLIYVKYYDDNSIYFYSSSLLDYLKVDFVILKETLLDQVVFIEAHEHSGQLEIDVKNDELEARDRRSLFYLSILAMFLFIFVPCYFTYGKGIVIFLLVLTKIVGVSIFYILLLRQYSSEKFRDFDKICSGISSRFSCSEILNSSGANTPSGLNLSELGMIYFFSSLINLTVGIVSNGVHTLTILSIAAFLAMLLVVYSLIYQGLVARKWCLYCLVIDLLIIVEAILYLNKFDYSLPSSSSIMLYLFICSMVIFIIALFKYLIEEMKEIIPGNSKSRYFFYNPLVFDKLLKNEPIIDLGNAPVEMFFGGKDDSKKVIVFVFSVKCVYCAKALHGVNNITELFPDYKVIIRLSINESSTDEALRISKLICNAMTMDVGFAKKALIDWAEVVSLNLKLKDWEEKYSNYELSSKNLRKSELLFNFYKDWAVRSNLNYSPVFIINRHKMPQIFNISNIKIYLAWLEGRLG